MLLPIGDAPNKTAIPPANLSAEWVGAGLSSQSVVRQNP